MPVHAPEVELTTEELAKKSYLKPDQVKELEGSIATIEERLSNPLMRGEIDIEAQEKQLANERRMLETGSPPKYDNASMRKIWRLEQHLREQITHSMPTLDMMERPTPNNVDFHLAWEKEHQQNVLAWKACLAILDPTNVDPHFTSIARLRTNQVPKGDPRKYANGFDAIKWGEVIEEDLLRDMDEKSYLLFLELRLLNWAKPTIMKKLDWSDKMYEAAMQRLREKVGTEEEETPEVPSRLGDPEADSSVPTHETHEPGWPRKLLAQRGIPLRELREYLGMSQTTFDLCIYPNNARYRGWPEHLIPQVEAFLVDKAGYEPNMELEPDQETTLEPAV